MKIIAELDGLLPKGAKISEAKSRKAIPLLMKLLAETQDSAAVSEYIMRLSVQECLNFFKEALRLFPEKIESLHTAFRATEEYKKNSKSANARGFVIAAVLIEAELEIGRTVLMLTLADAERRGKFSPSVIELFWNKVVEYCGLNKINALGDREWENPEMRDRFSRIMRDAAALKHEPAPQAITEEINSQASELFKTLKNSNDEAQRLSQTLDEARKLSQTLIENNGAISNLMRQIGERDARISELATEVQERDRRISDLRSDVSRAERDIEAERNQVNDLTGRLKTLLKMDGISQNQELATLKTDLAKSLKVEYADFINNKNAECDQDIFGAYRGSLTRIFKTLRRFGIMID
ncbi:MAG: hypothetical protein LBO21_00035 [Synergistaceae bacterium]|jgi:DNA repair exonuclease SbcCD ATPase subunit|nr:hypothetical protein [Synergistaceae bacterium]